MEKLSLDGIDRSQWIQKEFNPKTGKYEMPPLVNAFRAAKGDIIRNSDDKLESPTWLPRIMFLGERLTKDYYDTAVSVERIWHHARRTLGIDNIKGKLADTIPTDTGDKGTDKFLEMWRKIPMTEFEEMMWFISFHINALSAALPLERLAVIQHGLEKAQKMIDEWNKIRNNATSTSPEVCPELAPV